MEQEPQTSPVGAPLYRVFWHPQIKVDFAKITTSLTESIVKAAEHRLSRASQFIEEPLKGTTNLLWKISFSKYRIVYTMNEKAKEVWVLSVQKREIVYRDKHLQSLLKLAVAIQTELF